MDTKYTPGPWRHEVLDEPRDPNGSATVRLAISSEAGDCVCRIWSRSRPYVTAPGRHRNRRQFPLDDEAEANARLISASPALLQSCIDLLAIVRVQNGNLHKDINAIQDAAAAAITKATAE